VDAAIVVLISDGRQPGITDPQLRGPTAFKSDAVTTATIGFGPDTTRSCSPSPTAAWRSPLRRQRRRPASRAREEVDGLSTSVLAATVRVTGRGDT
jgi:hypothetical protein